MDSPVAYFVSPSQYICEPIPLTCPAQPLAEKARQFQTKLRRASSRSGLPAQTQCSPSPINGQLVSSEMLHSAFVSVCGPNLRNLNRAQARQRNSAGVACLRNYHSLTASFLRMDTSLILSCDTKESRKIKQSVEMRLIDVILWH